MSALTEGARVMTPNGIGKIRYAQLRAPDYIEPIAYSVMLERDESGMSWSGGAGYENYVGVIFPAEQVVLLEE